MAIGGYFAIIFGILALTAVALSIIDLAGNNIADRTSIIPSAALPPELQNLTLVNTYSLKVLFHSFNLNPEACASNSLEITGFSPSNQQTVTFTKYSNSTCIMDFTCRDCQLLGNNQFIRIGYSSPFVSSSAIEYYMNVPHFLSNSSSFGLHEILTPTDSQSIFKGPEPTSVSISLIQSYYTYLARDYLFNNVFSQSPVQSRTSIGFIATHFPTFLGSSANDTTFTSKQGLHFSIKFTVESTVFRISQEAKSSLLDFISKIAALIGAVSGVVMFLMIIMETIQDCIIRKQQERAKTETAKQIDAVFEETELKNSTQT